MQGFFSGGAGDAAFHPFAVNGLKKLDVVRYHRAIGYQSRTDAATANLEPFNSARIEEAERRRAAAEEEVVVEEELLEEKEGKEEKEKKEKEKKKHEKEDEEEVVVVALAVKNKKMNQLKRKPETGVDGDRPPKKARPADALPAASAAADEVPAALLAAVRPRKADVASIQDGKFDLSSHIYKSIPIQLIFVTPRIDGVESHLFLDLLQTESRSDSDDDLPTFSLITKRYGTFAISFRRGWNPRPLPCLRSPPFPKNPTRPILTAPYGVAYTGQYFPKSDLASQYSTMIADEYANFLELVQKLVLDAENVARKEKALAPWDSLPTHSELTRQYRLIPVSELSNNMASELEALVEDESG